MSIRTFRDLKSGNLGFVDDKEKTVTRCIFKEVNYLNDGFYLVKKRKDGFWGVLDCFGRMITRCIYYSVGEFSEQGLALVINKSKWGVIDKTGKGIVPCIYDHVFLFKYGLIEVRKDKRCGLVDCNGNLIVKCTYDEIRRNNNGLYWVKKNNKWGLLDSKGSFIEKCVYDEYDAVKNQDFEFSYFTSVRKNCKEGYLDEKGRVFIKCIYSEIGRFHGNFAVVMKYYKNKHSQYGVVDKTGKEVVKCMYDKIDLFCRRDGCFSVKQNGKWGFITFDGRVIIPCIYAKSWFITKDLAAYKIKEGGKWGIMNYTGKHMTNCIYDEVRPCFKWKGYVIVEKHEKADKKDKHHYRSDEIKRKQGFIDSTGKILTKCNYDTTEDIVGANLEKVSRKGKYGIIDMTGKEIVKCRYDDICGHGKYATVSRDDKLGIIDYKTGKEIIKCVYEDMWIHDGLAVVKKKEKWGIVDMTGKILVRFIYEKMDIKWKDRLESGWIKLYKNGKWKMFDRIEKKCVETTPPPPKIEHKKGLSFSGFSKRDLYDAFEWDPDAYLTWLND